MLDVYSRYVVGWIIAPRESAALAGKLLAATIAKQNIGYGQLTVHADRGSSMASKPVAFLLADLGVTKPTPGRGPPTTTRSCDTKSLDASGFADWRPADDVGGVVPGWCSKACPRSDVRRW